MTEMKVIRVTMPDGSVWQVPAEVVIQNRTDYYVQHDGESVREEELRFVSENDYVLMDWARNNMNWEDVAGKAVMVKPAPSVDFNEGWCNGQMAVLDLEGGG